MLKRIAGSISLFFVVSLAVPSIAFAANGANCGANSGVCVDQGVFDAADLSNSNINLGPQDCNYGGRTGQLCRKNFLQTLSGWGSAISSGASSATASLKKEAQRNVDALSGAVTAFGGAVGGYDSKALPDPLGGASITDVIGRVVRAFLGVVGALSLLVFVYAGVMYMTAAGESKKIQTAVDTMKYAFIGFAIILFAYAIATFYFQTLAGLK